MRYVKLNKVIDDCLKEGYTKKEIIMAFYVLKENNELDEEMFRNIINGIMQR